MTETRQPYTVPTSPNAEPQPRTHQLRYEVARPTALSDGRITVLRAVLTVQCETLDEGAQRAAETMAFLKPGHWRRVE